MLLLILAAPADEYDTNATFMGLEQSHNTPGLKDRRQVFSRRSYLYSYDKFMYVRRVESVLKEPLKQ